jgi:hypothetical protein
VDLEKKLNYSLGLKRHPCWQFVDAIGYQLIELLAFRRIEGQIATKENVKENAKAPHIGLSKDTRSTQELRKDLLPTRQDLLLSQHTVLLGAAQAPHTQRTRSTWTGARV